MIRLRCVCYARYSTDKQNPVSLPDQIRICLKYAWPIPAGGYVMAGTTAALLGIWPVSADASATTGVMKAQAAKKDSKGQAQAAERAEEAHSARDFRSIAEVVVGL